MTKKFNYVYVTTNLINNKQYVGSHCTDNIDDNYIGSGRLFLKAVKKYGKGNFKRRILEECETDLIAREKEEEYIKKNNTLNPKGYNLSPKGGIGFKGATLSEDQKQKMSIWQKGKTYEDLYGPEKAAKIKRKQSEKKKGKSTLRKGKGHKKELIDKYGEDEGLKRYNEFIKKISNSNLGNSGYWKNKSRSTETKKKISNSLSGKKHPNWGKQFSEKRKENIKIGQLKNFYKKLDKDKVLYIRDNYKHMKLKDLIFNTGYHLNKVKKIINEKLWL